MGGKEPQIPGKELIPWPMVFAQDIPQEAETTGNVCPASRPFHAHINSNVAQYIQYILHMHVDVYYIDRWHITNTQMTDFVGLCRSPHSVYAALCCLDISRWFFLINNCFYYYVIKCQNHQQGWTNVNNNNDVSHVCWISIFIEIIWSNFKTANSSRGAWLQCYCQCQSLSVITAEGLFILHITLHKVS